MTKAEENQKLKTGLSKSRLSAWLCAIGLHDWKEQRTIEWRHEYSTLFFDGDVCQRCGKHRCDPAKVTQGLPQDYKVLGPLST
jgi:hypothetical protein